MVFLLFCNVRDYYGRNIFGQAVMKLDPPVTLRGYLSGCFGWQMTEKPAQFLNNRGSVSAAALSPGWTCVFFSQVPLELMRGRSHPNHKAEKSGALLARERRRMDTGGETTNVQSDMWPCSFTSLGLSCLIKLGARPTPFVRAFLSVTSKILFSFHIKFL